LFGCWSPGWAGQTGAEASTGEQRQRQRRPGKAPRSGALSQLYLTATRRKSAIKAKRYGTLLPDGKSGYIPWLLLRPAPSLRRHLPPPQSQPAQPSAKPNRSLRSSAPRAAPSFSRPRRSFPTVRGMRGSSSSRGAAPISIPGLKFRSATAASAITSWGPRVIRAGPIGSMDRTFRGPAASRCRAHSTAPDLIRTRRF